MRSSPPARLGSQPRRMSLPSTRPTPKQVTCKGFYFRALHKELSDNGHHLTQPSSYRDFGDYSIAEAKDLLFACAERLYPTERHDEALRRIGWMIFPTLLSTIVGKVIFGSLGNDVRAALRYAGRGFEVSISEGRYEAVHIGEREADVTIRDFPLYPATFLVGVFEGALAHYGFADSRISVRVLSSRDVDMHLVW
jgi:uncharacterized protein (TIGR02265 family)